MSRRPKARSHEERIPDSHAVGLLSPPSIDVDVSKRAVSYSDSVGFDHGLGSPETFGYNFSEIPLQANDMHPVQPLLRTQPMIQRFQLESAAAAPPPIEPEGEIQPSAPAPEQPSEDTTNPPEATPGPEAQESITDQSTADEGPALELIIEDAEAELAPGQMRKSEFLRDVRNNVCQTVPGVIAQEGQTTHDCPYLDLIFSFFANKSASYINNTLQGFMPNASGLKSARDYIPIISARISRSAEIGSRTGEITGLPEGVPTELLTLARSPGGAEDTPSSTGNIQAKSKPGGAKISEDPKAIQAELGDGRPLDSRVRSRMEPAFGRSFSHVRVHNDAVGAELSNRFNARAFTLGDHVAFGAGEYQPGTLFGDGLIAHELAHVVQQSNATPAVGKMDVGDAGYGALEKDADRSTIGVVASLWGRSKTKLEKIKKNTLPSLRSGLQLQRCFEDCSCNNREENELPKELPKLQDDEQQQDGERPPSEPSAPSVAPLEPSGKNRLVPTVPLGCIPTTGSGSNRKSSGSFEVQYEKTNSNRCEITLRDRDDNDKVLHKSEISKDAAKLGKITIPSEIPVKDENHHYELEMVFFNSKGTKFGGLNPRPTIKFEVCKLSPAPTGENLLFAKALYAEGVDAGEFPYVRDVVYNRITWVADCPGDANDFGTDIRTVLNAPNQFASVLNNSDKFMELESELNLRSGDCQYTTPPRRGIPNRCRLINNAIQAVNDGDGNTHTYVFFRSNRTSPNRNRAIDPPFHYPKGNYYWNIRPCPPDRQ